MPDIPHALQARRTGMPAPPFPALAALCRALCATGAPVEAELACTLAQGRAAPPLKVEFRPRAASRCAHRLPCLSSIMEGVTPLICFERSAAKLLSVVRCQLVTWAVSYCGFFFSFFPLEVLVTTSPGRPWDGHWIHRKPIHLQERLANACQARTTPSQQISPLFLSSSVPPPSALCPPA